MLISVLASGSKGNSTLIKTTNHNILIDAGMTIKYLEEKLNINKTSLKEIDVILITHTHIDHVAALQNITKKYKPTLIMTTNMLKDLNYLKDYEKITLIDKDLDIDNLKIESIPTSHDAGDGRGYIITEGNSSMALITDTGYLNRKHFKKLENKDLYIFESNYDPELLMNGKYPKWLQQRVNGDEGHLSNEMSSFYLCKLIGPKTKKIILAHLSEENNTEELALSSLKEKLKENNLDFNNITAAKQKESTKIIEI